MAGRNAPGPDLAMFGEMVLYADGEPYSYYGGSRLGLVTLGEASTGSRPNGPWPGSRTCRS